MAVAPARGQLLMQVKHSGAVEAGSISGGHRRVLWALERPQPALPQQCCPGDGAGGCRWRWVSVAPRPSVTEAAAKVWIFRQISQRKVLAPRLDRSRRVRQAVALAWALPGCDVLTSGCWAHGLREGEQVARGGALTGVREHCFCWAAGTHGRPRPVPPPAPSSVCHAGSGYPGTLPGPCRFRCRWPYVVLSDSWLLNRVCVTWSHSVTVSWVMIPMSRKSWYHVSAQAGGGTWRPDQGPGPRLPALPQPHGSGVCAEGAVPRPGACAAHERNRRPAAARGARSSCSHDGTGGAQGPGGDSGPGSLGSRPRSLSPRSPEQQLPSRPGLSLGAQLPCAPGALAACDEVAAMRDLASQPVSLGPGLADGLLQAAWPTACFLRPGNFSCG